MENNFRGPQVLSELCKTLMQRLDQMINYDQDNDPDNSKINQTVELCLNAPIQKDSFYLLIMLLNQLIFLIPYEDYEEKIIMNQILLKKYLECHRVGYSYYVQDSENGIDNSDININDGEVKKKLKSGEIISFEAIRKMFQVKNFNFTMQDPDHQKVISAYQALFDEFVYIYQ
ncbi:UNKNOWN [Stylonychia lemnae]|uniref:Uncharacterized protein n=1 Tax=Stylonychia lemnae TaxID=5949 RepID=A0A078B9U5_STYLE|nr:UNKNOWN [Stylonychia lemnae]|eukprot:CDW90323.1 UNKNOWN [Stylonychia lemnae]